MGNRGRKRRRQATERNRLVSAARAPDAIQMEVAGIAIVNGERVKRLEEVREEEGAQAEDGKDEARAE